MQNIGNELTALPGEGSAPTGAAQRNLRVKDVTVRKPAGLKLKAQIVGGNSTASKSRDAGREPPPGTCAWWNF